MVDIMTKPNVSTQDQTMTPPAPVQQAGLQDRRRPGRIENPSPELIALMRKPSAAAIQQVALYDAPHFVLPTAGADTSGISVMQVMRFATAFGICAAAWMAALKMMMVMWG